MVFIFLNIISALIIAAILIAILIFDRKRITQEMSSIKLITFAALLVAISVILNTILCKLLTSVISAKILQLKIGNFALILIGLSCGGVLGALSGIAADFIGIIINSTGVPVLFFTLTNILWCVLPFYLIRLANYLYQNKNTIYVYLILAYTITLLIISSTTPIVLMLMLNLGSKIWALYITRIIVFPISVLINSVLLIFCYRSLRNILNIDDKIGVKLANYKSSDKIKKQPRKKGTVNG